MMFESLNEWIRFPVTINRVSGKNAAGDPVSSAVSVNAYIVDIVQTIKDKNGKEYASSSQVFFKEDTAIDENDTLSFPDKSGTFEIKKLSCYYDGTTGSISLRVAYL